MALKDHYLIEDFPQVINEIDNLLDASLQTLRIAEEAEFSTKNEQLAKINRSLEIIHALNRKKIDREVDDQANEYLRRHMF